MEFTDKDRQALVELINNIQHAFFSEQASVGGGDSTKIALPCRLVRSAAEVLEQSYRPELVGKLGGSEVELLVTYLSKAVDAMSDSLKKVAAALPAQTPASMVAKLEARAAELQTIRQEREDLFGASETLLERESEILGEKRRLEELQQRHQLLLRTREQLRVVDLEALSREVLRLETELGSSRIELEQLQRHAAEGEREREVIDEAVAQARQRLSALDQRSKEVAARLASLVDDLLAALDPYMAHCEKGIQSALRTIADKTAEGKQLEQRLKALMPEVNKVCEETAQLSGALKLYADADHHVARSVPAVMNVTREKLIRVEEQLQEIDGELRQAIERHQSARHIADTVSLGD